MKTPIMLCALLSIAATECMDRSQRVARAKKTIAMIRTKPMDAIDLSDCYSVVSSARTVLAHDKYNYPYTQLLQDYKKRIATTIAKSLAAADVAIEQKVRMIDELNAYNQNDAEFTSLLASREDLVNCAFQISQIEAFNDKNLSLDDYCNQKLEAHQEFDALLRTTISDLSLFSGYIDQHRYGLKDLRHKIQKAESQKVQNPQTLNDQKEAFNDARFDIEKYSKKRMIGLGRLLRITQLIAHTYAVGSPERMLEEKEAARFEIKLRLQKLNDTDHLPKIERYVCEIPLRKELRDTYNRDSEKYKAHDARVAYITSYVKMMSNDPALLAALQ